MLPDFSQCLVTNSRMAARAVTRRYDAALRPYGVTSAQFALLGALQKGEGGTVTEIAIESGIERTALTRNLDRLEAMGLAVSKPALKGNGRRCELTEKGAALIPQLVPAWERAQDEMRKLLSAEDFSATLTVLKQLTRAGDNPSRIHGGHDD